MNLVQHLKDEIERKQRRIVVCGDAMTDRWVHGRVLECQDGCPKFIGHQDIVETPGGAANAANSLSYWNVVTSLRSYSPHDYPIKTRYVDHDGRIVFRTDSEYPVLRDLDDDLELALEQVRKADAVLLSDYDKGFLTPDLIAAVIGLCKERGTPCVADAKRGAELYAGAVVKGNKDWHLKHRCDGPKVITLGSTAPGVMEEGSHLLVAIGRCIGLPPVECINHVGAGDCFVAHLTLALTYGFSLEDAAALAHSAGRVYVQHPHNRPPRPEEIEADLGQGKVC